MKNQKHGCEELLGFGIGMSTISILALIAMFIIIPELQGITILVLSLQVGWLIFALLVLFRRSRESSRG